MNPDAVTLIFPVAYLNNPASMFGHTLFHIYSKTRNEQKRRLSFAFKGLFGGYPGSFSVAPYYVQVKRYGDVENRDIWEYLLALTDEEVRRMLMHAWELKAAYFDYYFLDENCSYQLLSLLEAARPSLHLLDQFRLWAVPADTVRAVTDVEDLISSVTFRPSRRTVLQERTRNLYPELQNIAKCIGDDQCPVDSVSRKGLSPMDQSKVLELAMVVISDRFDEMLALGAGPNGGIIFELTEQWRMAFFARSLAFTLGSTQLTYDIALEQAIDLTPGSGLRIRISRCQEFGSPYNSVSAGYLIYF